MRKVVPGRGVNNPPELPARGEPTFHTFPYETGSTRGVGGSRIAKYAK